VIAAAPIAPPPAPRIRVALPPAAGGGARALGLRLTRGAPGAAVVVAGVDPRGAAASAGGEEGCALVALLREGVGEPLWGATEACEEEALRERLAGVLAAGGPLAGEGLIAEFVKAG
jgi:hypothetical protein